MEYMFRFETELDQKDVDRIVRKYHIPDHYMF